MIDSDELLAIGAALVQTVRSQIKYSYNMNDKGQLFDGLKDTRMYTDLDLKFDIQRNDRTLTTYIKKAQKAIELRAGLCGELVKVALYVADMIKVDIEETIYTSTICLNTSKYINHGFLILHQSEELHRKSDNYEICAKIDEIKNIDSLNNAILVDPWIYCAHKLEDLDNLLETAKNYNVSGYYINTKSIEFNYFGYKSSISSLSKDDSHTNKYYNILNNFYTYYKEQKQKLLNKGDSFARGRRYSSVRRSLEYNIQQQQQQQQQLTSLRDFFTSLKNQSSYWYGHFGHRDNKGFYISNVITYLNTCINNYYYPSEAKLIDLFECILRILPIVRSSNTAPRNLSINTIDMTKSAKGLFNLAVTPQEKYAFEEIPKLDLKWVRNARNFNDRGKYNILLTKIAEFTAPYDINKILPNFYTDKGGYYELVKKATPT
ncbi:MULTISPECIES: hypothetical protein [Francisella]|uniref:Uncharacterized protein n=1 Tax=Francisella opportunistica TaxID=2016517 RepID=A0A345JQG6_9GAMM|nr:MULTISPECIES: hypothetical protein [Francisella]APC91267.1 hypothetical protein BBG19_0531 [Francisella sp. MA067296]AXH29562.1 hypothetical protein CGC43_02710 [Francisella opportunistica]AXH31213.1 hypothetical protein CGC44_02685 [Francisella opportunistica]AXH32860.1 hypothetical protein CGC45_02695 [Francisella opportunistica]